MLIYARTRAYLLADGSRLTVRRFKDFHTVEADELIAVNQISTPNGASYALTTRGPDGKLHRSVAPTALLKDGPLDPVRVDTGPGTAGRVGPRLP